MTRKQYQEARRQARTHKGKGEWLHLPVRVTNGYPGEWVGANGTVYGWYGFDTMWELLRSPNG
jgi:hypothetical protein